MKTIEGSAVEVKDKPQLPAPQQRVLHTHAVDASLYSILRQVQKAEAFDQLADLHYQIKLIDKQISKLARPAPPPSGKVKYTRKPSEAEVKTSLTEMSLQSEKKALQDTIARLIERISPMGV